MATGCLSTSKLPEIPGIDRFAGRTLHTAHWPHEGVDFTGRRVAVIGTGSSGIQAIPLIADEAADLTVFQRTANFSMPANNAPLSDEAQAQRKQTYPEHRRAARESGFGVPVPEATRSALEVDPEERRAQYESTWGRQPGRAAHLVHRQHRRRRRQRDRRGVRPRQDPRDRRRPGDRRDAVPARPPVRHQAALPRLRVLRDVQPRARAPRRPEEDPADRGHRARRAHHASGSTRSTTSCSPPGSTP